MMEKCSSSFKILSLAGLLILLLVACAAKETDSPDDVYEQALACATTQICLSPEIVDGVNVYPDGAEKSYDSVPGYAAYVIVDAGQVTDCPAGVHEYGVLNWVIPPGYENGTNDLSLEAVRQNGVFPGGGGGGMVYPVQIVVKIRTSQQISPVGPLLVSTSGYKSGEDAFGSRIGEVFHDDNNFFYTYPPVNPTTPEMPIPPALTGCDSAWVALGVQSYGDLPANP